MDHNTPFISIIVPVYNDERRIVLLLDSISRLSYPKESYEVIVVDNLSNDNTQRNVKNFQVNLLEEKIARSSYAARNKGIINSKGDIIAFTDSDCIIDRNWLKTGVQAITKNESDLVGGKIQFYFSNNPSGFEYYDSLTFMQNEEYIKYKNSAATANLFVKRIWFQKIGLFPLVSSGGDALWTQNAVSAGANLSYSKNTIVYHPARSANQLLQKCIRVGRGGVKKRLETNKKISNIIYEALRNMLPNKASTIQRLIKHRGEKYMKKKWHSIWIASSISKCFTSLGLVLGIIDHLSSPKKQSF